MTASPNSWHRASHLSLRHTAKRASLRLLSFFVLASLCGAAQALPILTEIHYNGPAAGSDPDEFLEISNSGNQSIDLSGYRFTAGISFSFPRGSEIAPAESLVIARDPEGFRSIFTDYSLALYDFSGALSNSGEAITLADPANSIVWSLTYDDNAPWPDGADGDGLSLQLRTEAADYLSPSQWIAAQPTPGIWRQQGTTPSPPTAVPAPMPLLLMAAGILALSTRSTRLSVSQAAGVYRPCQ